MLASRIVEPPSSEERWLRFSRPHARVGERAYLAGQTWLLGTNGRWSPLPEYPDVEIGRRELERAVTLGNMSVRRDYAAPDKQTILRDFPELTVVDHPDGTWEARGAMEPERRKRLDDVFSGQRAVDLEQSDLIEATTDHETLVGDNGYRETVRADVAPNKARKQGLRGARKFKGVKNV